MAKDTYKSSMTRGIGLICCALGVPLTALWLTPSLHNRHQLLAIVSMSIPLTLLLWPLATLSFLITFLRSRKARDLFFTVFTLAGTSLHAVDAFPYAKNEAPQAQPAFSIAVIHANSSDDVTRAIAHIRDQQVHFVQFVEADDGIRSALASSGITKTHPHSLTKEQTILHSALPLTEVTTPSDALVINKIRITDTDWTVASVTMDTPLNDAKAWSSSASTLPENLSPYRDSPLVISGYFGNSRFCEPIVRLTQLGFTDARAQTGTFFSASWPIGSKIRPIVAFDHAFTSSAARAVRYTRLANNGDDYLGFIVTVVKTK